MNKIILALIFASIISLSISSRPPGPVCRTSPLPSLIPVSIGETLRLDLENIFDGYNLQFEGPVKDHIKITPKYVVNSSNFIQSMNFTSAKIKDHNRFLGLATHDAYTRLAIGVNHPESGVTIQRVIQIQDQPQLRCYDVDQIVDRNSSKPFAIIDCAVYRMGQIHRNQFLYVDLTSYKLVLGSRISDVFVRYNHLKHRAIQLITDPFTRIQYLLRFYVTQWVDNAHSNQTYVEIFMITNSVMDIQILDVIDHTVLNLPNLAIYDYQIHMNFIYLLVKNEGLFQLTFSSTQRLYRTSFFPIRMNVNRFRVEQNGFNDDLHLVLSNENTVYQYEWDTLYPPVLVRKYNLMSNSIVEDLLLDEDFVIVQAWEMFNDQLERRTWIFSDNTLSYTNAFGAFRQPNYGPSIMIYDQFNRILHLIHQYRSFNIRINLPYLWVNPVISQKAGDTQQYLVKAVSSTGLPDQKVQCRQTLKFIYIQNTNTSIIRTGLQGRNQTYVDAPDDMQFDLQYEFFGRNISYEIKFNITNATNETKKPEAYVEKRVKAQLHFPSQINQSKIIYFEMFLQNTRQQIRDRDQIFGLVQTQQDSRSHPIYYINCYVQMDAEYQNPVLRCRTIQKTQLSLGRIQHMSQMFSPYQRVVAIVFSSNDAGVYLYYLYSGGFVFYGMKTFGYQYNYIMSSVQITAKRQLVVTYQYGKRIEIYNLDDLHQYQQKVPQPVMTIDTRFMEFFRINYFAPIKSKVSIYHDQVSFVQTRTGIMAFNINQMGIPELLFHIRTNSSQYDFQVNKDTLVLITEHQMALYRLSRPLRRREQPFLLQKFTKDFNLNQYDEINSDGLFYLVEKEKTMLLVIHPNLPSTSVIYCQFEVGNINMIDAVRSGDKEILFIFNGRQILAYMFAQNPKLKVRWWPYQSNFTMNISAYNQHDKSEPYLTLFHIIDSNQAFINTTDKFNPVEVRKLGHVTTKKNAKKMDINITLNDSQWFTGNVMHYFIKCKDCNKDTNHSNQMNIVIQNHLAQLSTEIKVGQPVYDLHSTHNGIYGQLYNAVFKTYSHNDSVQYIVNIPTTSRGQVCSKLSVHSAQDYMISFCQLGGQANIYITTLNTFKPFTMGPFPTQAQAVNHVQIVGNIVMIVDNDDDPFNRAGGVYLYYLDLTAKDQRDMFTMLDYLDYADLQIEGFRGTPHIASADIHKPLFNKDQYAVFLTQARTGDIFVFLFQVSNNKQQAVYIHRRMFPLNRLIPESVKHPTPLRVININIMDYTVKYQSRMQIEYILLLTVKNWHHIQLMILVDQDYDLLSFQLKRLFERVPYPWELTNFMRLRKGSLNASYLGINYRDFSRGAQVLVVYQLPYFRVPLPDNQTYPEQLQAGIPITRVLAAYRINDTGQTCFDFNSRDQHRLLFNDVRRNHLNELQLNKELKIIIKNADPSVEQAQNITIIAENHYTNLSFVIQFKFNFSDDDDKSTQVQIIWIIVLIVGFLVVVGLIFAWSRQNKSSPRDSVAIQQSLLTVQPQFKSNYINRSSADPQSVRDTVDYAQPTPTAVTSQQKTMQKVQDPVQERIQNNENIKA